MCLKVWVLSFEAKGNYVSLASAYFVPPNLHEHAEPSWIIFCPQTHEIYVNKPTHPRVVERFKMLLK